MTYSMFDAGNLAASFDRLDPATVQSLLGHSKITTTERYLHARPLTELAERMDSIFGLSVGPLEERSESRS